MSPPHCCDPGITKITPLFTIFTPVDPTSPFRIDPPSFLNGVLIILALETIAPHTIGALINALENSERNIYRDISSVGAKLRRKAWKLIGRMLDGSSGSVTATLMYDHVYKVCASYSGRGSNNERKSCLEHYCTEQFAVDFTAQMNVRCATVIDRFARQMETKPEENLVNILQEVQTSLGAQVDLTEGEQYPENTAEIVHHINMVKEAHAFAVFAFDAHTT